MAEETKKEATAAATAAAKADPAPKKEASKEAAASINPVPNTASEYNAAVAFGSIVHDDDAIRKSMAEANQNKADGK